MHPSELLRTAQHRKLDNLTRCFEIAKRVLAHPQTLTAPAKQLKAICTDNAPQFLLHFTRVPGHFRAFTCRASRTLRLNCVFAPHSLLVDPSGFVVLLDQRLFVTSNLLIRSRSALDAWLTLNRFSLSCCCRSRWPLVWHCCLCGVSGCSSELLGPSIGASRKVIAQPIFDMLCFPRRCCLQRFALFKVAFSGVPVRASINRVSAR